MLILLILILLESGKNLSELKKCIKIYPQVLVNARVNNEKKATYKEDKEMLSKYSKILYAQARLIEGLDVENPSEVTDMLCDIISK